MTSPNARPSRFRGWWWTLTKCAIATVTLALVATAGLYVALRNLVGRLPDWVPSSWTRWMLEWTFRHVWVVGPALGIVAGVVISLGIVVVDAKRGRLTRVR